MCGGTAIPTETAASFIKKRARMGSFFNSKTSEEILPSFAPPVTLKHILGFLRFFMSFYAFLWVFYRSFSTKTLLFHPNKSYN